MISDGYTRLEFEVNVIYDNKVNCTIWFPDGNEENENLYYDNFEGEKYVDYSCVCGEKNYRLSVSKFYAKSENSPPHVSFYIQQKIH